MKTDKVFGRLSAVALTIAGGELELSPETSTSKTENILVVESSLRNSSINKPDLLVRLSENAFSSEKRFINSFASPHTWDDKDDLKYSELVRKEALEGLNKPETEILNNLQRRRRSSVCNESGEEIVARYKRQKLDQEMLELLKRHVRIEDAAYNT